MTSLCIGFCTHGRCYHLDCPTAPISSLCQRPGKCIHGPRDQIFQNFNAVIKEMSTNAYKASYDVVVRELRTLEKNKLKQVGIKSEKEETKLSNKIPLDELMSLVKSEGFWFQKDLLESPEIRKQYGTVYVWNWLKSEREWTEIGDPRLNSINLASVGGTLVSNDIILVNGYLEQYVKSHPVLAPTKETIFRTNLRRIFRK